MAVAANNAHLSMKMWDPGIKDVQVAVESCAGGSGRTGRGCEQLLCPSCRAPLTKAYAKAGTGILHGICPSNIWRLFQPF